MVVDEAEKLMHRTITVACRGGKEFSGRLASIFLENDYPGEPDAIGLLDGGVIVSIPLSDIEGFEVVE
ncbi:hypothetical protein [Collinsella vaginalis]|uniref:hypothetical protein n=1 Tax=Collinsella vaginalis TaxID=1870987 RepID=UPI000A26E2B8|nr:hypothetical protein [Collinsella vaginalis]